MPFNVVIPDQEQIDLDRFDGKPKRKTKKKVFKPYVPGPGPFGMVKQAKVARIIRDEREALYWLNKETGWIGLDLETSGLSPYKDMILVLGLYGPEHQTACVLHVQGFLSEDMQAWLGSSDRRFVTQNGACFDIPYCHTHGVDISRPTWYDTLIGEQVVTGTDRRGISKDLQSIVKRRLGVDISKDVDHRDWLTDELSDMQVRYVAEDISFLPAIMEAQYAKARETDDKWGKNKFYGTGVEDALNFEMSLMPAVIQMEINGLPVNQETLLAYESLQREKVEDALIHLTEAFGDGINWGSHVQVKKAFKDTFDFILPSTQADELVIIRDLASGSPIADLLDQLLYFKHAAKRASMYNQDFLDKYTVQGRVHANFRQVGTDTGRFSSASPNFQQLPGDGRNWVSDPYGDYLIVAPDYSQIEIRIAANEAEDEALISAFASEDVHTMIAALVFGVPPEQITKEQRKLSKAMSFTLLFGGGAQRLTHYAQTLGADLPLARSTPLVKAWYNRFKGLNNFRNRSYAIAQNGRPFTLNLPTGMRRVLTPGIDLSATRIMNNIVQGTAAAGLKYGMMEAYNDGLMKYLGATVHDELVAAVPTSEALEYGKALADAMIRGMERVCEKAPVHVEVKMGGTWS
jgi:DNA polymerase-1